MEACSILGDNKRGSDTHGVWAARGDVTYCTHTMGFYGLIKGNGSLLSASAGATPRYKNITHCLNGAFS